jgi:pyruvate,water dikinase
MDKKSKFIAWFKEVEKEDTALVGGKGANLGEMTRAGFPVPNGFIVTSNAYYAFVKENDLKKKIINLLSTVNVEDSHSLMQVSADIRKVIRKGKLPTEVIKDTLNAYKRLSGVLKESLVAVRSSATAEDLADASFAGQQETYLNVKGEAVLLEKIKEGWASLFAARAIYYRHQQKYDHIKVGIALVVQEMVESEKSGIMFTIDPVTNDKSRITIESIYGLGELIVQGAEMPDHYELYKDDLKILNKKISKQKLMLKRLDGKNKKVRVPFLKRKKQKISDEQIINLGKIGKELEKHYYFPQDIEWAIKDNKIYIVQTRAITTTNVSESKKQELHEKVADLASRNLEVILTGDPASPGISSGPVKILRSAKEIGKVKIGDVLVASQTNPDFVPAMKKAVAIVTDKGGRTSHAAIVSREIGIPAVVGTTNATKILKDGNIVTVNGIKGEIYKGGHTRPGIKVDLDESSDGIKTATKIYVNLADPDFAERTAKLNADGVGLLRAEFMMAGIGTHPKKMIHDGKKHLFVKQLANGLETFCKAFYPRPVVYRASDFKTNEYRNLIGGKAYEPEEPNPMLGFRGAYRYVSDPAVFNLELEAIKHVRNKLKLNNLWLMLPFVRTVKELEEVKRIIAAAGLNRDSKFKLWMMVEIPSNVILLPKFIECGIDGVSIGSNDLTMLILGTDRDNEEVASEFDEQNDAVLWALENVIKTCRKYKITASICGQAASTYPHMVEKIVRWGVTSVSVSPDAVNSTRRLISEIEKKIIS